MTLLRTFLLALVLALVATPAWASPSVPHPGGSHSSFEFGVMGMVVTVTAMAVVLLFGGMMSPGLRPDMNSGDTPVPPGLRPDMNSGDTPVPPGGKS